MGDQSAENALHDLQRAFVRWVEIRCRDRSRKAALNFYSRIVSANDLSEHLLSVFRGELMNHLWAVKRVAVQMNMSAEMQTHRLLPQWKEWADQICDYLPDDREPDWRELLISLTEDGNELISACVSASLLDTVSQLPVAMGFRRAVEQMATDDASCFDDLQLPPNCRSETTGNAKAPVKSSGHSVAEQPYDDSSLLKSIVQRLEEEADAAARLLASQLGKLGPSNRSGLDRGVWQRQLLQCLMEIDDRIASPGALPSWLGETRAALRQVLTSRNEYIVLDRQLVRRSIRSQSEFAEAIGFSANSGVPPHCITRVVTPGYALRRNDGSLAVIQQARVLIAQ